VWILSLLTERCLYTETNCLIFIFICSLITAMLSAKDTWFQAIHILIKPYTRLQYSAWKWYGLWTYHIKAWFPFTEPRLYFCVCNNQGHLSRSLVMSKLTTVICLTVWLKLMIINRHFLYDNIIYISCTCMEFKLQRNVVKLSYEGNCHLGTAHARWQFVRHGGFTAKYVG
jgi:hypothetical protein